MMRNLIIILSFVLILPAFKAAHAQDAVTSPVTGQSNIAVPASDPALGTPPPAPSGEVIAAIPSNAPVQIGVEMSPIEKEINERLEYLKPNIDVDRMKSLFFTVWEHDLVLDARRGLITRTPGTDDGLNEPGPRDIALGGIVYHSGQEWTIWLNNVRVSPNAIPDEILDLKVFKEYVDLEWFDESTNQVFPIRLRAHQRFNLDTRMFLPG